MRLADDILNDMELTEQEVEKLAALARIELTAEEKKKFGKQISSILDYAKQVQDVDTSKAPAASSMKKSTTSLRKDIAKKSDNGPAMTKQFPDKTGELNKVKSVLG